MDNAPRHHAPDLRIGQIFSARAAANGGVIRRNRRWVEHEIGRDRFVAEMQRRGFHLLDTADQLIVVCHAGPVRMHFGTI